MTNSNTAKPGRSTVTLERDSSISNATKLHVKLIKSAARGVNVDMKGSAVEVIDTAALQLLLAFVREVKHHDHCVDWKSPSETLYRAARLSGLQDELGLSGTCI